jgi:hypothetical protein
VKKTSEYRQHAVECRQLISIAPTEEQKATLENMARTWDSLADDRERFLAQTRRIAQLETMESDSIKNGLP